MLQLALGTAGFGVREAVTGAEALAALAHQPADAVLLDLTLPDGMGADVLHRLRRTPPASSRLPVWLIMSALDPAEAAVRFGDLGPHYIRKPFDPWHVVRLIESLLSRNGP